jgi:peptidyl-prolyl cis-trans isomerase D
MKKPLVTKISTFAVGIVFTLIIVSFLFGDFNRDGTVSVQDIGSVNGHTITPREYQMRLAQQIEFFGQMMGGSMTPQQIEQMGIKETVLSGIIQQKLLLSAGQKMGLVLSDDEVKAEIKKLPPFQQNGQFSVTLYRNLLEANQYTPAQFEDMISNDVTTRKMEQMIAATSTSQNMARDVLNFKLQGSKVEALRMERQDLVSNIPVTDAEASEFGAIAENKKLLEDMYQENIALYQKPEEAKARHILFRAEKPADEAAAKAKAEKLVGQLTAVNFAAKAKELTEDPSGKSNGGDLGWFSRGRMVPEFEEAAFKSKVGDVVGPIKTSFGYHMLLIEGRKGEEKRELEQVKVELSRQALQKRKVKELDQLMAATKARLQNLLASSDKASIEVEKKNLKLTHLASTEINQYDLKAGSVTLTPEEGQRLAATPPGTVLDLSTPSSIFLLKVQGPLSTDAAAKIDEQLKTEVQAQSQLLSRKFREELLKELNTNAKIVTNPALL